MNEPSSAVVHFYRAIVMHADVWRERLDTTTNWAVVTTIGVISFAFSRPQAPHFVLLLLTSASGLFLIMESRRYQTYDLWRRRIRSLNKYIIAPQISGESIQDETEVRRELDALARDLGRAVPHLRFIDALGYRLRRNYGYIYLFTIGSWVIKLYLHPSYATTSQDFVERAAVGVISGSVVILAVILNSLFVLYLALRAPSEQMLSWRQVPSPLSRIRRGLAHPRLMAAADPEDRYVRPGALAPRPLSELIDQPQIGDEDQIGDEHPKTRDHPASDSLDHPDEDSDSPGSGDDSTDDRQEDNSRES